MQVFFNALMPGRSLALKKLSLRDNRKITSRFPIPSPFLLPRERGDKVKLFFGHPSINRPHVFRMVY